MLNNEKVKIKIPLVTVSEANKAEHWTKATKRHRIQKNAVKLILRGKISDIQLPCHIKLTRIAPRKFDKHENLPCSMKYIVDAVCELIKPGLAAGRADDDPGFSFEYCQRMGEVREYAIEIEIINL